MSYISEKVSYLQGLADGIELDNEGKDKLLRGILDALGAVAEALEEHDETIDDLSDCIDGIYDELDDIETAIDDEFDGEMDEDDFIEVVCPHCGETVYFDEDMIDSDDGLICPNCNETIEFEIPGLDEETKE